MNLFEIANFFKRTVCINAFTSVKLRGSFSRRLKASARSLFRNLYGNLPKSLHLYILFSIKDKIAKPLLNKIFGPERKNKSHIRSEAYLDSFSLLSIPYLKREII